METGITIGQIIVPETIPREVIMENLTSQSRKYIRDEKWDLSNRGYINRDGHKLFKIAACCTIKSLNLCKRRRI